MVELVIKFRGARHSISVELYTYEVHHGSLAPHPPKKALRVFLFMHYFCGLNLKILT